VSRGTSTFSNLQDHYWSPFFKEVGHSIPLWYSLNPLHRESWSLADLLEVSPETLQHLIEKGGFGKLGQAEKVFCFLPSQFESFHAAFMMEENCCEVTRCKIKGMKTKEWFVRLGSEYNGDLSDPRTKGGAPQV
jgi:hypothetical protein